MKNKKKTIKKRNPIVLEMIKMKGYGTHKKSNKQNRLKDKVELNKSSLFLTFAIYML